MKIDGNELAILQNDLDRRGQKQEAWKVKQEFLKQVRESGDHCPCQEKCPHHGNCFECVTLHRGHGLRGLPRLRRIKELFMHTIRSWCRTNAMLVISLLAAAATAFFVPPDSAYLGYYDLKTLSCLFSVLAVVGALRDLDVFSALSQRMVHTFSTVRGVCTALVVITMFGSMLLTNDTALLTFLPLGWFVLSVTGQEKHAALLFILQNCAANLCGMITPFGNPQNLYLFSYYGIPAGTFFSVMLPPFILSTVLILLCCLLFPKDRLTVPEAQVVVDRRRAVVYGGLFCLAVAMVLRLIPYGPGLAVIVLALWFLDRHALKSVDWGLLATFAAFFTFSGNLARMEPVRMLFVRLLSHGTMLISALTCQIISNVPAAILLSRFTQDARGLLVGVNVGGAGTLVASLASLITFREYTRRVPGGAKRFLILFSAISFAFLAVLLAAMSFLG